jgi:hypothetical protein
VGHILRGHAQKEARETDDSFGIVFGGLPPDPRIFARPPPPSISYPYTYQREGTVRIQKGMRKERSKIYTGRATERIAKEQRIDRARLSKQ